MQTQRAILREWSNRDGRHGMDAVEQSDGSVHIYELVVSDLPGADEGVVEHVWTHESWDAFTAWRDAFYA